MTNVIDIGARKTERAKKPKPGKRETASDRLWKSAHTPMTEEQLREALDRIEKLPSEKQQPEPPKPPKPPRDFTPLEITLHNLLCDACELASELAKSKRGKYRATFRLRVCVRELHRQINLLLQEHGL